MIGEQTAGVQQGDLVKSVGGVKIETLADFRAALKKADPKQGVRLQLQREGMRRFVFLKQR